MDKTDNILQRLNPAQQKAVAHTGSPLLVLAGAGSGKTQVLTSKIAWLISHEKIMPWRILAVTFTNKAANEMKERVQSLLGENLKGMQVSTFHSFGLHMLFRNRDKLTELGYPSNFVVYDRTDCLSTLKRVITSIGLDPERYSPKAAMDIISSAKSDADIHTLQPTALKDKWLQIYQEYAKALIEQGALDFDDLILLPLHMMVTDKLVLASEQNRLDWILVDEYQDVNKIQYQLMQYLSGASKNLMVVGDPDQSIYGWRGADITMILNFEIDYPDATIILLEQNYRSTCNILDASNAVISNNINRHDKNLWTSCEEGDPIHIWLGSDERAESSFLVRQIEKLTMSGYRYGDIAILYRMNSMSRTYEQQFIEHGIPYKIVRGIGFYERKEVKDVLGYMRLAINPWDRASLGRVGNLPAKGLGPKSLEKLGDFISNCTRMSPLEIWQGVGSTKANLPGKAGLGATWLANDMINILDRRTSLVGVVDYILQDMGYEEYLKNDDPDSFEDRYENIKEIQSLSNMGDDLETILAQISLYTDMDTQKEFSDSVSMSSLHAAKGLEFPVVFMVGMEEGIFPHSLSKEKENNLEEERRLCYVGMTRAQKKLYMTAVRFRRLFGATLRNLTSRFLKEIPEDFKKTEDVRDQNQWGSGYGNYDKGGYGHAGNSSNWRRRGW